MKSIKLTIIVSVIILIFVLYLNYDYKKVEKFTDPPTQLFTGTDALKTIIFNGFNIPVPPSITVDSDLLCDRSNPDKPRCLDKVAIIHPLTPITL